MEKIRYRLVYNRKKQLNRQGVALVQVEASLDKRKVYFKTNIYLKPEHWDGCHSLVCNHPHANELNAMLFEFVIRLQTMELEFWKRGVQATLSLLKDAVTKGKVTMFANVNIGKSVIGLNMRYVFMSHGGCLPPPTASPECFSWYFLKKKLVRRNWIVYLKSETSYKPINNVPICKEKNFPLKGKRFS